MSKIKILLVEHDTSEAEELRCTLEYLGYDVPYIVSTGQQAVKQVLKNFQSNFNENMFYWRN